MTALSYAHAFAQSKLYVFPCRNDPNPKRDKTPLFAGWRDSATIDMAQIDSWALQYPGCRWGVECEASGLFILDSDIKLDATGETTVADLEGLNGRLPTTYTVRTKSGGVHRYFYGVGKNKARSLGPALDTRSAGGYAIIPDGIDYTVTHQAPIAPAPTWAIELAGTPKASVENPQKLPAGVELDTPDKLAAATAWLVSHEPAFEGAGGDAHTFATITHLRDLGVSKEAAPQVLHLSGWNDRCEPSWNWDELQTKIDNAYRYAKNQPGGETAEAAFAHIEVVHEITAANFQAVRGDSFTFADIPLRDWVMNRWYQTGQTTATVSAGGVGKSMLSLLEAVAVVTGLNLTGFRVVKPGPVWFHSEDTINETKRRVAAICTHHGIDQRIIRDLHITSNRQKKLPVAEMDRNRLIPHKKNIQFINEYIQIHNIRLAVFDPFIKMHKVNENDNNMMEEVTEVFNSVAEDNKCAVGIVHHAGKGRVEPGNMANARGATAIVDAVRLGRTVNLMTQEEAKALTLAKKPNWYMRLDNGKSNYSAPADSTDWYEKHSKKIDNGEEVGVTASIEIVPEDSGNYEDDIANFLMSRIAGEEITLSEASGMVVEAGKRFDIKSPATARKYVERAFMGAREFDGLWYSYGKKTPGLRKQAAIYRNRELEVLTDKP